MCWDRLIIRKTEDLEVSITEIIFEGVVNTVFKNKPLNHLCDLPSSWFGEVIAQVLTERLNIFLALYESFRLLHEVNGVLVSDPQMFNHCLFYEVVFARREVVVDTRYVNENNRTREIDLVFISMQEMFNRPDKTEPARAVSCVDKHAPKPIKE